METGVRRISRRDVLTRGVAVGGVGAAAGLLATATGAGCASAQEAMDLTWDVACLGDTFRIQVTEGNEEADFSGNTFYVEGNIYPEGTIEEDEGFDPAAVEASGLWVCRGWFMIRPDRADPHVITTQEYIFGDAPSFPADHLVSSGPEGADDPGWSAARSVIGGTGRYQGATGSVTQSHTGVNTTVLRGIGDNAPNFRFDFRVLVPEL